MYNKSMATTVTLNSDLVQQVQELTGAQTKTEAVREALLEYIKARKRRELLGLMGRLRFTYSNEKLEKLESD
jgi:Arc/MetJ family transcription regulator